MIGLWAWTAAQAVAGPSAALCEQWGASLTSQAQQLAATDHVVEGPNVRVDNARVRFDDITASLRDGVCHVRAAGKVDLRGQVQVALYGMQTACPVRLAQAPIVSRLELTGTSAKPHVVRSFADIEGLKPRMSLCVDLDLVKGFVVDIAQEWIAGQLPGWHGAIEQSLAQR